MTWREALRVWVYIGVHSFGGSAGQIAVMHKVLVERTKWISEDRFLHALNYCMLLPGPEAMQLATYMGWLLHKTRGGIVAGTIFVLPGFLSILALSIAYTTLRDVGFVQSMLMGLQAAVLVIVIEALLRISKRALGRPMMYAIAGASFLAVFALGVPFPLIIGGAALIGFIGAKLFPNQFTGAHTASASKQDDDLVAHLDLAHTRPSARKALGVLALWLPLWLVPVLALGLTLGWDNIFAREALFFSKASTVTFGGAYAVLSYIAQQAVEVQHWLEPSEMLTGLGMAETTPGPLIQVVQFVGYMGAYRQPGAMHPLVAATLASALVTWVTFVPCFLWIFLGGPYMESLRGRDSLRGALSAITAAVVGVILNLAIWFALHTLFRNIEELHWHGVRLLKPDLASVDLAAIVIALVAGVAMFAFRRSILTTLAIAVALSALWYVAQHMLGMTSATTAPV